MKTLLRVGGLFLSLGAMLHAGGAAPSAERIFRRGAVGIPVVNPAGTHVAVLMDDANDQEVAVVFSMKDGVKTGVSGGKDHDIFSATWLDDTHVLFAQSLDKLYADGMFVVDTKRMKDSYMIERDSVVELLSAPVKTPLHPLVWVISDVGFSGQDGGACKIDAEQSLSEHFNDISSAVASVHGGVSTTSDYSLVRMETHPVPPGTVLNYEPDALGELAMALTLENGTRKLWYLEKNEWRRSPLDADEAGLLGAGDEPGQVWLRRFVEGKPRSLEIADVRSGERVRVVREDADYTPSSVVLLRDPGTHKVAGFHFTNEVPKTQWLDSAILEIQKRLDVLFPDELVFIENWDRARTHIVAQVFSDTKAPAFYLVDLSENSVRLLTGGKPELKDVALGSMIPIKLATRDGFKIDGYLTIPPGASKEHRVPLIVMPHGGPFVNDDWGFDPEVQFFVTRGYAVLQPNYRGSPKGAWRFGRLGPDDFLKMGNDVIDATRYVFKTGLVDPKRVSIVGGSFGGFLSVTCIEQEPELFRSAVSIAGVYDWDLFLKTAKHNLHSTTQYDVWSYNLNNTEEAKRTFESISPLMRISRIKVPLFVAHGGSDSVVDMEQSKKLIRELEKNGLPVESYFKSGEGHGMHFLRDQVELYEKIEVFLEKYMKP